MHITLRKKLEKTRVEIAGGLFVCKLAGQASVSGSVTQDDYWNRLALFSSPF